MSILNWSPLFLAVWQNDINAFNPLTTSYSHDEKDSAGNTLLHLAAMRGGTEILRILISLGSYVHATNNVGETPLHFAARNGHTGTTQMLINSGADVNAKNDINEHEGYNPTALHLSLLFETDETIEDLEEDMEMDIPTPPTTLTQPIQPETETNPFACSSLLEWPSYNYDAW
jgi:ankyrin repeat protein